MAEKLEAPFVDENEFFRQATLRISSSLNIEVAMKRCLDFLKDHIPASGMVLGLYDPTLNVAKIHFLPPSGLPICRNLRRSFPTPWNFGRG